MPELTAPAGGEPRARLGLWVPYLLTRLGIVLWLCIFPIEDSDIHLYFDYAVQSLQGRVVYQDFKVEYPPLAYAVIRAALPAPRDALQYSTLDSLKHRYFLTFRGYLLLADLISFLLLLRLIRRHPPAAQSYFAWSYLICTFFLATVVLDRLDGVLGVLLLMWLLAWSRSFESAHASVWFALSGAALGLGIAYKMIPVIALPVVVLVEVVRRSSIRRLVTGTMALVVAAAAPFLIAYMLAGPGVFHFLEYHGRRGVQVESLYAAIMMIMRLFGAEVTLQHAFGSWNLTGDGAELFSRLSSFVLILYIVVILALLFRVRKYSLSIDNWQSTALAAGCFVIGGAVIFSKVFSPQYLVWAFPLMLLGGLQVVSLRWYRVYGLAWCVTAALTAWIWPVLYRQLITDLAMPAQVFVISRNVLYLALVVWALVSFALWRSQGDEQRRG